MRVGQHRGGARWVATRSGAQTRGVTGGNLGLVSRASDVGADSTDDCPLTQIFKLVSGRITGTLHPTPYTLHPKPMLVSGGRITARQQHNIHHTL